MRTLLLIIFAGWYILGASSFIYFKRYKDGVTLLDMILALTWGGMFGIFTLYICLKGWYGFDILQIKLLDKKIKPVKENKKPDDTKKQ